MSDAVVESPPIPDVETDAQIDSRSKRQPPYALILHNDDDHTFNYVINVLRKVCGHSKEKAFELTLTAHQTGRAMIWTGALEIAELKRDQIRGFGPDIYAARPVDFPLGVTIEPLPSDP